MVLHLNIMTFFFHVFIELYKQLARDRSKDTLHGAFLDMTIHSADPVIAEHSKQCMKKSMEIGRRLGVKGVVFHTGLLAGFKEASYMDSWLEINEAFFRSLCSEYSEIEIYMENMFDLDPELWIRLGERLADVSNFGLCLDYAHASLADYPAADWLKAAAPFVKHMHINDNDLRDDLHLPVGEGKIDWNSFKKEMKNALFNENHNISILIEVKGIEAFQTSMMYWQKLWEE